MEFRRIEYFLVLADELSFVRAAQRLCITPQALTKQISLLEGELGVKLFDRTTRSVSLTRTGSKCLQKFSYLKAVYDDTLESVFQTIAQETNLIKMGIFSPLPRKELVFPILEAISSRFPNVELEIHADDMDALKDGVFNGKYDLCITNAHDYQNWIGYERVNFKISPAQIVVSPNHKWAKMGKSTVTEEDMATESILLLDVNNMQEKDSFYHVVKTGARHYVRDFDSMLMMLNVGHSFAVFPPVFNGFLNSDMVTYSLPERYAFNYRTMCACHKSNQKPEVWAIMDYLRKNRQQFQL
ncbi:MAG: LysR family transcriptional regulator [Oscillospiraceae bacterium]|nr:LysR family transcriptional regulator [Oscillospiraceae bacterium]